MLHMRSGTLWLQCNNARGVQRPPMIGAFSRGTRWTLSAPNVPLTLAMNRQESPQCGVTMALASAKAAHWQFQSRRNKFVQVLDVQTTSEGFSAA